MEQQSTLRLMAVAGIGLIVVAIIAVIRLFEFNAALPPEAWQIASEKQAAEYAAALKTARDRWDLQGIAHYELIIERHSSVLDANAEPIACAQDVEVRDEKVAAVIADDCPAQPAFYSPALEGQPTQPTISALFGQIAHDTRRITWSAEGIGCSFVAVNVAYDQDWGYPHRIEYLWQQPPPEFGYPIDARYFLPGTPAPTGKCGGAILVDGPQIVITLNVLP